jgi:hypothetical protein
MTGDYDREYRDTMLAEGRWTCGECDELVPEERGHFLGAGRGRWFRCEACTERDRIAYEAVFGPDVDGLAVYQVEGR